MGEWTAPGLTLHRPRCPDAVEAPHELSVSQHVPDLAGDTRHDPHAQHHVVEVGQLHPNLRQGAPNRTHAERDHVHHPTWPDTHKQLTVKIDRTWLSSVYIYNRAKHLTLHRKVRRNWRETWWMQMFEFGGV